MKVLDTEKALNQNLKFVHADIKREKEKAFRNHQEFFSDSTHQKKCSQVVNILRTQATSWKAIYKTPRSGTRFQGPYTEIKIDKVWFRKGMLKEAERQILSLGISSDDVILKPKSNSVSVKVR